MEAVNGMYLSLSYLVIRVTKWSCIDTSPNVNTLKITRGWTIVLVSTRLIKNLLVLCRILFINYNSMKAAMRDIQRIDDDAEGKKCEWKRLRKHLQQIKCLHLRCFSICCGLCALCVCVCAFAVGRRTFAFIFSVRQVPTIVTILFELFAWVESISGVNTGDEWSAEKRPRTVDNKGLVARVKFSLKFLIPLCRLQFLTMKKTKIRI